MTTSKSETKEQRQRYNKAAYVKHRDKRKAYDKAHSRERKETMLKLNYGLSLADFEAMLADQGGVCKICCKPNETRALNVDHDHQTGKVRGLLCDACNVGLGRFKDDERLLRAAVTYLERHQHEESAQ